MQMRLEIELARQLAAESILSCAEFHVLEALDDHPEGRMRLYELAEALGWEKSRASHQVVRMVERGLVRKSRCPTDRRGAYIAVTAHGRRAIDAAVPAYEAAVHRIFVRNLTPDQLDGIVGTAEAVLEGLDEQTPPDG